MAVLVVIRFAAFVQFLFTAYYFAYGILYPPSFEMDKPSFLPLAGRSRFLTVWNLVLQTCYFFIAFLNDLIGSDEARPAKSPLIRRVKDYVFAALAFPSAMYVGITFWSLWAVDRELVFPKALDEFFPSWLNHLMHTNIMIFIVLEMWFSFRKYPSKKNGLAGMVMYLVAYLIWMHVIYYHSGKWVYPVLEVLNWPLRIVFYLASLALGIILYLLGEFLNNTIWSKQLTQAKKSSKRKAN